MTQNKHNYGFWIILHLDNFFSSRDGNVAILFGLLALPIFAAIGAAIDTGAVYSAHKQLQNLVDSAAIAGASKLGVKDDQRIETAEAFIKSNSAQIPYY